MKAFISFYLLTQFFFQKWHDPFAETNFWDDLEANEETTTQMWAYRKNGIQYSITLADLISCGRGVPNEKFMAWVRHVDKYIKDKGISDTKVLMSAQGCGGSDYLLAPKVREYLEEHDGR